MRKVFWIIGLLIVVGAVAIMLSQTPAKAEDSGKKEKEKEAKKVPIYTVELEKVQGKELRTYVASNATLKADRQVDIYSKVSGQVLELKCEEGQRIYRGDVLVVLDGKDEKLQLGQIGVQLEQAKAEYDRIKKSYDKSLVSTEEYDTKKFEMERIQAEYDLAVHKVELTQITAPFDGTIVTRMVEVGQTIQPSEKLFILAALDPLEAEVFLTESQVAQLKIGQRVSLSRNDDFSDQFFGVVQQISPIVDRETGTIKVTIAIHDAPSEFRPGSYVHLRIVTGVHQAETVVSKKSLVFDSRQNTYVFVATPQTENEDATHKVSKVQVEADVEEDGFVSLKGVEADDLVVLTGKEALKEGSLVKSIETDGKNLMANM